MKKIVFRIILIVVLSGLCSWLAIAIINRDVSINNFFVGNYLKGVDISSYQEEVDFRKLKDQHIEFAYIKATEGSSHIDNSFEKKWKEAEAAGMPTGAYHYFSYQSSGVAQADNFIKTVGNLEGKLVPAIDMELTVEEVYNPPEKEDVVRGLKAFLAVVEEHYRVKPIIYANKDYYDKYLADDFSSYPKWARNVYFPIFIERGEDWTIWQYNDKGILDGYSGEKYIDLNVLNNLTSLDSLTIKSGGA